MKTVIKIEEIIKKGQENTFSVAQKRDAELIKNTQLGIDLSRAYIEEFYSIANAQEALKWVKSAPYGMERTLLLLLALDSVEHRI